MEVAEFLHQQDTVEDCYPGMVSVHLSFTEAGLQNYQLILGGRVDNWVIGMNVFQTLPHYEDSMMDKNLVLAFEPSQFIFLQNQPVSAWVKIVDCAITMPEGLPDNFSLSYILVRLRFSRAAKGEYQLILEAILEFDNFNLAQANKSSWAKTIKAMPVCIFACDVPVSHNEGFQLEIMPTIRPLSPMPASVSDSSIRFAVTKCLIECSSASWSRDFLEWLAHARVAKHPLPPSMFSEAVVFPITQFQAVDGKTTLRIKIDGEIYMVTVGRTHVARLMDHPPPSYEESMLNRTLPPLNRANAVTMASAPPAITMPPVPVVSGVLPPTSSGAAALASTQPLTASVPSVPESLGDAACSGKRKFNRLPKPSKKHKYSENQVMAAHMLPGLPPNVVKALQLAFASNSQARMIGSYNKFVAACGGRDPFQQPHHFDSVLVLDYLLGLGLAPATVAQHMSAFSRWSEMNNLTVSYKPIISLCLRGDSNGSLAPLRNAKEGFKLPFTFSTLKLICSGLQHMKVSNTLKSAVWAATLLYFWGMLRANELLAEKVAVFDITSELCLADIVFHPDGTLKVWIKNPKVKNYHGDIVEYIPIESYPAFCPIAALTSYLKFREAITLDRNLPLMLLPSGSSLTHDSFTRYWKSALRLSLVPEQVIQRHSTHGLRASLPSLLQMADIPDDQVKIIGRWKSDTSYNKYLKNVAARSQAKRDALSFCQKLFSAFSLCKSLVWLFQLCLIDSFFFRTPNF